MQLSPKFLVLLLHIVNSVQCNPETGYEDLNSSPEGDLFSLTDNSPLLYDDSALDFQPYSNLDPPTDLILTSADSDHCLNTNTSPNRKLRVRESVCPSGNPVPAPTVLDIPDLGASENKESLCPLSAANLEPLLLVCGKPFTAEGLIPDTITTVTDAYICQFPKPFPRT